MDNMSTVQKWAKWAGDLASTKTQGFYVAVGSFLAILWKGLSLAKTPGEVGAFAQVMYPWALAFIAAWGGIKYLQMKNGVLEAKPNGPAA